MRPFGQIWNFDLRACCESNTPFVRQGVSNFSFSLRFNWRNRVTTITVIARSEATWQSPGRMLDDPKCSKHRIFWLILLFYVQLLLVDRTGRLPRRQKPPRNDTVVGSWSKASNGTTTPNFALRILHFAFWGNTLNPHRELCVLPKKPCISVFLLIQCRYRREGERKWQSFTLNTVPWAPARPPRR